MQSQLSTQKQHAQSSATFESGALVMREKLRSHAVEAYYANEKDPLHAAFQAKAVIHSGPKDMPVMGVAARSAFDALANEPRSGKCLAYIHVPFCETRCLYCLFYQNPYKPEQSSAFASRLIRELELTSKKVSQNCAPVHAVYFGGGTPTALEADDLKRILKALPKCLPLANDCEITVEGRIHNFTDEKMEAALEGGANRFSLGIQSFNSKVRQSVMRVDDRDTLIARLEKLISSDNAAVVMDLIYGFPGQSLEVWEDDLKTAASLALDGVDCYQLNVFEKSPLAKYIANGKLPAAADSAMKADMFAMSVEHFTNAQWRRLSNNHWGRTTRERNIYNALGKSACDCLAFGCGAGGRLKGHSFMIERKLSDWEALIDAGQKPVWVFTRPGPHWRMLRTVSAAMESGAANLAAIGREYGVPVDDITRPVTDQWIEAGLLVRTGEWLVQTVAGQYWHVTLAQLLIDFLSRHLVKEEA